MRREWDVCGVSSWFVMDIAAIIPARAENNKACGLSFVELECGRVYVVLV